MNMVAELPELSLDVMREVMANPKLFAHFSYDWRAKQGVLPNAFGRTRSGVEARDVACLISRRREARRDFAIAQAGLKLLVEREGQPGGPEQTYVLLRDENNALISSIRARLLYDRLKDQPANAPLHDAYGKFWWISETFSFVALGARREEDDGRM